MFHLNLRETEKGRGKGNFTLHLPENLGGCSLHKRFGQSGKWQDIENWSSVRSLIATTHIRPCETCWGRDEADALYTAWLKKGMPLHT
jgi:hypothetical protein